MNETYIVSSNELSKHYHSTKALDHVNINIPKGCIYGLVGNNGAGKTTFLKLLAGQIFSTSGSFNLFDAKTPNEHQGVRCRTGAIIENPSFFPKLTALQNLEYYRIQRGIPGKNKVRETLKSVNLEKAANKKFDNLSLGMKQRLGLALALMGEPELLILDEPINGLDPSGIIEIRSLLLKLNKEKNITIIISSHILSELENIATHYGFLHQGQLIEQTSADDLKEKCRTYLEITVTDAEKYTALLETKLQCTNYKVLPENIVHVLDQVDRITDYSALAVQNGIGLLSFEMKERNLENYYMNLIGNLENGKGIR